MKEKWNIAVVEDADQRDDAVVFEVDDMIAAVSLMPAPIPNGEAEANAENNYLWKDAVKVAKEHRAHLMVAVLGKEENILEKGCSTPSWQPPVAGKNMLLVLHQRRGV